MPSSSSVGSTCMCCHISHPAPCDEHVRHVMEGGGAWMEGGGACDGGRWGM